MPALHHLVAMVHLWSPRPPSICQTCLGCVCDSHCVICRFFKGKEYLEIDVDVHSYAYLARKAFSSFIPRLATVVFENAFVVQGNQPEELPEVILACARVSRVDFNKVPLNSWCLAQARVCMQQ